MFFNRKACCYLIGLFFFITLYSFGQNQEITDRLTKIYENNDLVGIEKLELLRDLSFNAVYDFELSLKYAEELISLSIIEDNNRYLFHGYLQKGNTNRFAGNLNNALNAFFKSVEVAMKFEYIAGQGAANIAIADVYSEMGNSTNAATYYDKGIQFLRKTNDTESLATALLNAGDEAFNTDNYNLALEYFEESGILFKNDNYLIGTAYNLGNIGMVYAEQGKDELAESNINEAIAILEELEDYYPISVYLTYMSDIYSRKKDFNTALAYLHRSLNLAQQYGLKDQISDANLKLTEFHERKGDSATAYKFFKEHIEYRDLVINLKSVQETADLRTNFEVSQEQAKTEISEQKRKTERLALWSTLGVLFLIGVLAYGLFKKNKFVRKTNKIIAFEKDRSDKLLLNILPEETAQELKDKGRVEAKQYPSATVLFSDFKGFTSYAENLSPEQLVQTIDYYFSKFDLIMETYGLEKIKTIGDAYMAVGGLSYDNVDQAKEMVLAAKEMNEFVAQAKNDDTTTATFDIRIGINTGPVVAGVVGTKKFAYDIWGDTVNIASRMESNSEPGRINISEHTYEIIKHDFDCEYRGEIAVKNRGVLKMYFLSV
ncbi:adenylate/guanylate cyclase domain-containing protein [Winogradskyella schleiferi]|uniref:adenylate/guanylate cyclase domain-containing protein n=1 Tax=Winogradskyella schleiferi TaxID=2686078 RepID=UPI0015BCB609|nr:adenylate/guanylate cyclase domain-containing protein [Winogradskyella schleiferi]